MSWKIVCTIDYIDYMAANNNDESFFTNPILLTNREIYQEKSSGYQEPDDDVMVDTYIASSDHGDFKWTVTARRSGFNSFAELENIVLAEPYGFEALSSAYFAIQSD